MRFLLSFLLIALSFSGNGAKAQELDAIPAKIQQNWGFPDCGRFDHALVFTKNFYLRASKKELTLLPYEIASGSKDYRLIRQGGESLPVRIENDGILKIGIPAEKSSRKPDGWEGFTLDRTLEYAACPEMPKIVPKAMTRLFRYLDRIQEQCTVSINNDCARVIFKLADDNSDKKLTSAEIKKATLSALIFAELGVQSTLGEKDMKKVADRAKEEGQKISDDLLSRFDANKSGDLDYNELTNDFSAPKLPIIKEMLKKSGNLLPVFQMAAATLP